MFNVLILHIFAHPSTYLKQPPYFDLKVQIKCEINAHVEVAVEAAMLYLLSDIRTAGSYWKTCMSIKRDCIHVCVYFPSVCTPRQTPVRVTML